jgi:hypothetical protein
MIAERSYYSRWACNGFRRSQSNAARADTDKRIKRGNTSETPTIWEEGTQVTSPRSHRKRGCADAIRNSH